MSDLISACSGSVDNFHLMYNLLIFSVILIAYFHIRSYTCSSFKYWSSKSTAVRTSASKDEMQTRRNRQKRREAVSSLPYSAHMRINIEYGARRIDDNLLDCCCCCEGKTLNYCCSNFRCRSRTTTQQLLCIQSCVNNWSIVNWIDRPSFVRSFELWLNKNSFPI